MTARSGLNDIGDQESLGSRHQRSQVSDPPTPRLLLQTGSPNPSAATTKGNVMVTPIGIPDDWDDNNLILFEEFCELIRTPQRTVRDWRRRGIGPKWTRFQGVGRLYITVAEARRFLASATVTRAEARSDG